MCYISLHWPVFTHWECSIQVCCLHNALMLWIVLNIEIKMFLNKYSIKIFLSELKLGYVLKGTRVCLYCHDFWVTTDRVWMVTGFTEHL
jgi:hypothetical protein